MPRNSQKYLVRHTMVDVTGGKLNPANHTTAYHEGDVLTVDDLPGGEAGKTMLERFLELGAISPATSEELDARRSLTPATGQPASGQPPAGPVGDEGGDVGVDGE